MSVPRINKKRPVQSLVLDSSSSGSSSSRAEVSQKKSNLPKPGLYLICLKCLRQGAVRSGHQYGRQWKFANSISTLKNNTILIIDDDLPFVTALAATLRRAGYTITIAANGLEGLRSLEERLHDVVITDIVMPEKEGIETIIEIRRKCPACKIIAMSGGGRIRADDYLQLAKKLGANATIDKPFAGAELVRLLEAV